MTRSRSALLLCFVWASMAKPAVAREEFFRMFREDPYQRVESLTCAVCHVSEVGGDTLNDFGAAFNDAGQTITPLLRASFPDRFGFYSTKLADGSSFHFADPESNVVIFERDGEKHVVDLADFVGNPEDVIPPPANRMSFFVTSVGPGNGGHLEGLAGADRHCQELAAAVGAFDLTWRAYLSTSFGDRPAVNAGDRIGTGPWFNAKGKLVARGVSDLHRADNDAVSKGAALNERGEVVNGRGDEPNRHDILTGTLADGTAAVGLNCSNWTSAAEGAAMVGHHDRERSERSEKGGDNENGSSWNAAHATRGCSQEDFRASGGDGLFYCFAIAPQPASSR